MKAWTSRWGNDSGKQTRVMRRHLRPRRSRIAHWQSVKLRDKTEEEEDGWTIIREKERFSDELTPVFAAGEIAVLKILVRHITRIPYYMNPC